MKKPSKQKVSAFCEFMDKEFVHKKVLTLADIRIAYCAGYKAGKKKNKAKRKKKSAPNK